MKSITKHDILRAWSEKETINLSIMISLFDEENNTQTSGSAIIGLLSKTIKAKIYNEAGSEVLSFLYQGAENPSISVQETANKSVVTLHFKNDSYGPGKMTTGANEEKWYQLELAYAVNPGLYKNVFPFISKTGVEMRFYIKLLRNRVN